MYEGNPFHKFSNQKVIDVINSMTEFDFDLARWAIIQVFVINKTPRSINGSQCLYEENINGVGCAIALITPSHLKDSLKEECSIDTLINSENVLREYYGEYTKQLCDIQRLHDGIKYCIHDDEKSGKYLLGEITPNGFSVLEPIKRYKTESDVYENSELFLPASIIALASLSFIAIVISLIYGIWTYYGE